MSSFYVTIVNYKKFQVTGVKLLWYKLNNIFVSPITRVIVMCSVRHRNHLRNSFKNGDLWTLTQIQRFRISESGSSEYVYYTTLQTMFTHTNVWQQFLEKCGFPFTFFKNQFSHKVVASLCKLENQNILCLKVDDNRKFIYYCLKSEDN